MARIDRQRPANIVGSFFELALSDQNVAKVVKGLEIIGPQAQCPAIAFGGAGQITAGFANDAQKDPSVGELWISRDRLLIQLLSRLHSARLEIAPGQRG